MLSEKVLRVGCVQLKKVKAELELFLCCMTKPSSLPHQPKTRNAKTRELPPNRKAVCGI